jgi:class 3 adenylate cyclase/tetratricopeptide (TPR) repeat protein
VIVCPSCGEENPERARFCHSCGAGLAEPVSSGEERKVVSVLFVDLVGFTDRSDRADPEDVRATLRPYHERVKADIERFGGTVEKFIGDAVMAVFGAPIAHEDDAERALRSALRVLETIEELRREGLDVAVRAAVTTGEAVVALGARPERGEGIVAGDVVNTAARLQSAAPAGTVIADETTMRSAEAAIAFEALEDVAAKGKAAPIRVWRVVQARSRIGEPETPTRTPFVGRQHERAVLFETFLRVERESAPQLVTVVGEAGVGKSRLVAELRSTLDDRPELVTWRHGRCLPYGEGITFWALGEVVKAEAGILESDDQDEAAGKLEQSVSVLVDDSSEREWFTSRLAPLAGVGGDAGAVGRDEAFTAWRRFLEALAARRPLVMVVEDLHWADEALLDFLEHLLDWAAPVPLLVLSTTRPELFDRRPGWSGGKRNATTISLSPLSADETARLLQGLLERALLPAETQASILERAGGNPLYTEQFARMLTERGDTENLPLPETVQALIAARLDTLSPELKALLHDASVVGKTFWTGAVAAIGERGRDEVLGGIRELVRREFVRPARVSSVKGEEEFSIWHALVRDVAYQQIPRAPRARKHVAAAAWIEEFAQERIADHAEILVHHYEQARELSRAAGEERSDLQETLARFLLIAGDRAMQLDIAAAEAAYRRALELSAKGPGEPAVLVKLANALQEQGLLLDAEEAYEQALPALRADRDEHAAALAMLGLGRALWRHGQTARGRELTREAIPILEREPGPDLVFAYERAAGEDAMGGRPREALEWTEKGIALAKELGVENVVRHLQFCGMARLGLGDVGGLSDMRDALDLSLRLGLGIETATSYGNLGEMLTPFDGVAAGLELVQASLDFARRCGLKHHEMWVRTTRLWYFYELGEWDELLREADEVLRWDREHGGSTQIEVNALIASAPARAQRGNVDEARRDAATFLPRAREVADPQTLVPALVQAAFAFAVGGELDEAVTLAAEFGRTARAGTAAEGNVGMPTMLRICVAAGELPLAQSLVDGAADVADTPMSRHVTITGRAILAEAHGRTEEAAILYAEAAGAWGEWGSVPERAYALLGLGRCGDEDARREAEAIFASLGAVPFIALAA